MFLRIFETYPDQSFKPHIRTAADMVECLMEEVAPSDQGWSYSEIPGDSSADNDSADSSTATIAYRTCLEQDVRDLYYRHVQHLETSAYQQYREGRRVYNTVASGTAWEVVQVTLLGALAVQTALLSPKIPATE